MAQIYGLFSREGDARAGGFAGIRIADRLDGDGAGKRRKVGSPIESAGADGPDSDVAARDVIYVPGDRCVGGIRHRGGKLPGSFEGDGGTARGYAHGNGR